MTQFIKTDTPKILLRSGNIVGSDTNKVVSMKYIKTDTPKQYLRNGNLKSNGNKADWEKQLQFEVDSVLKGTFSLNSNGYLTYTTNDDFDLYRYIIIDSTPVDLIANVPYRIEDNITFRINNNKLEIVWQ